MKILLDTNIIMDALQERTPFDQHAKEILIRGQRGEVTCLLTANAVSDIFYLYSRARDSKSAKIALDFILKTYGIVSVDHKDCIEALAFEMDDFEDALALVCAQKEQVEYIITRDEKFSKMQTEIKVINPSEFLAL